MREEYFNIDDYGKTYNDIDYLNPDDLENITGDNIFLTILKNQNQESLNCVAAIDGRLYNFNTHKYINDDTEILYARSFSDYMPSSIWRLIYIVNYGIISIDIDDYKSYLFERFEEIYNNVVDKDSKKRIIRNGYITPKFKKIEILNEQNLANINGTNIFLAILENNNINKIKYSYSEIENIIKITYEEIDTLSKILKDHIKQSKIMLPSNISIESWIEDFKYKAIDELDKFWYCKTQDDMITANFIASINGKIYNFCTNEYLNYNKTKINYVKPIEEILPKDKWKLSYSESGRLTCITVDEDYIDSLIEFECTHSNDIDKEAKTKVLRNGYKITP